MIWKNPFVSKNSEQQMDEGAFLSLFDCEALQIIDPKNLEKVSFLSSSPGAGKTSLFRAFSARVLARVILDESDKYKDIKQQMTRLGVIEKNQVFLSSAILSCARGYSIIDEMFQNGRRKQIFFALINYRIAIALLKSIGTLFELSINEYDRIEFVNIPAEMYSDEIHFNNGKSLYEWACYGERSLCKYLDSERSDFIDISFVHTTLLILKLFEPENILIDKKTYFHNTLIIFDDFHKLTENQRKILLEAIYTLKSSVSVWLGQRLEGIDNVQLVSMDGSLNRDYNSSITIDNYWPDKQAHFYTMLERIADKRIKDSHLSGYNSISDCLDDQQEVVSKESKERLNSFIKKQLLSINENPEAKCRYQEILNYINENKQLSVLDKAIWIECILIQENRRSIGQMYFYFGEKTSLDEFCDFVKKNYSTARYYVCYKNKIPFYYGLGNLKILSSYNVEQFLFFAGAYFDCCRIKSLEHKRKKKLSAEEQEKALEVAINQKWSDMDYRFANISEIKAFLDSIAKNCIRSRDSERASYAGGAYTGIGFDKDKLLKESNRQEYRDTIKMLGVCLSSKYLERKEINNGSVIVFYLNRWLCVHYMLPLSYGGWFKCSLEKLSRMGDKQFIDDDQEQLEMSLM